MPKISVLLPVHNEKPEFLDLAIASVLKQTFANFELLLLDDGSDKPCAQRLDEWTKKDGRVKVVHLPHQGITKTLNAGIEKATGKFVARMDSDDMALPNRFEKQITFLEQNPDHAAVGSWVVFINEKNKGSWIKKYPAEHEQIKCRLIAHNSFTHSAIMFCASQLKILHGYNENLKTAQDYDLLLRAAWHFKVANIPEVLLRYRYRDSSISWKKSGKLQERDAIKIRWNAIKNYGYPKWQTIFLLRPIVMLAVPKWIKFAAWKKFRWATPDVIAREQGDRSNPVNLETTQQDRRAPLRSARDDMPYDKLSLINKLQLLFKSNLTTKQKIKGVAYILLKQRKPFDSATLRSGSNLSRKKIADFVYSLKLPYTPFGQFKFAPSKVVPSRFASCFAYKILDHLGELDRYTPEQRKEWAEYIRDCQDAADGLWYEIERNSKTHDQEYIALQLTTFALELLEKEGLKPKYPIKWLDKISFPTWLYQRDFSDPWKEGNRILFVGQLLYFCAEDSSTSLRSAQNDVNLMLSQLINWLDETVDPQTGFWGTDPNKINFQPPYKNKPAGMYEAMLGAYHQYILYKLVGRTPPYIHSAVTNTLDLQYPDGLFRKYGGGGACEDMDAVEILIQGYPFVDHKTQKQIQAVLQTVHNRLINLQHTDGGFAYNPYLALCYSGIPLLECEKGESDIFSTWFRLKTLDRISNVC